MPDVDVLITTYNHGPLLHNAVRSAAAFAMVQRIIVVDDASNPPASVPNEVRSTPIELVRLESNVGPSAARNYGLTLTTAPYVINLDGDDALLPGVVDAISLAEKTGAVAVVSARTERTPDGVSRERAVKPELAGRTLPNPADVFRPIALFGASGVVLSRRVIDAGIRFDESLRHGEDREFLRRVANAGPIAVNPVPALEVTIHPRSADNLNSMRHLSRRIENFTRIVEKHWEPAADGYMQEQARWLASQASKNGCEPEAWRTLTMLFERRGWKIPLRTIIRRLLKRT